MATSAKLSRLMRSSGKLPSDMTAEVVDVTTENWTRSRLLMRSVFTNGRAQVPGGCIPLAIQRLCC